MDEGRPDPNLNPAVLIERMYSRTRKALDGSPRMRSIVLQEAVDGTIDDVARLAREGSSELLGRLLERIDVEKVHPEMLDTVVALVEDMTLPAVVAFRDRVDGRLAQVDEILKPVRLQRDDGSVVSHDVRKDARELYRERARAFGDALRRDGNLDAFYRSARMRARARGEDPGDALPSPGAEDPGTEVDEVVLYRDGDERFSVRARRDVGS